MKPTPEGRVFRAGATVPVLFIWALMTGALAGTLILHAIGQPPESESRNLAWLMGAICLLIGPVPLFIHFVRLCLVWVSIEEGGVLLSSGRAIPWQDVRSVELKESAFKGFIRTDPMIFFATAGMYAVLVFVVFPSMALLTPWHQRVILTLGNGEKFVLRDLMSGADFTAEVSRHLKPA